MANNEILPFAGTDTGTNLLTQAEYNADSQRPIGNQPGVARSKLANKVLRQTSLIAAAIAQIGANNQSSDVVDTLSVSQMAALLETAIKAVAGKGDYKDSCRLATTANIASLTGLLVIDGVQTVAGDRVLVKDQTSGAQNGIYVVAAGAWPRAADFDQDTEVTAGAVMPVEAGTSNGDSFWMLTTDNPIVVGTTALTFQQVNGGTVGTAGTYNSVTTDSRGRVISGSNFARKNVLDNGNFDVWQRGLSGNMSVLGFLADRWRIDFNSFSGTGTVSAQTFTVGQTSVPNEPKYWHRAQVTAAPAGQTAFYMSQKIEGVRTLAGKNATLSFYAKADSNRTLSIRATQLFGTGGSPSASNQFLNQNINLTTNWQLFTIPLAVPSISGKTLGTAGDDSLQIIFDFPLNATFTYDLAQVQLEEGTVATNFDLRPLAETMLRCRRFCRVLTANDPILGNGGWYNTTTFVSSIHFDVPMRTSPSGTFNSVTGTVVSFNGSGSTYAIGGVAQNTTSPNGYIFSISAGTQSANMGGFAYMTGGSIVLSADL